MTTNYKAYGDAILNDEQYKFVVDAFSGKVYRLNSSNYYIEDKHSVTLRKLIATRLGAVWSTNKSKNIEDYVKIVGSEEIEFNPHLVACKNGLLDIEKQQLVKPEKTQFPFLELNAEFNPEADVSPVHTFVEEIALKSGAETLQCVCGNVLAMHYITKKIVFLIGHKNSGKTTLTNVLSTVVGDENTISVAPYHYGKRFITSKFFRKALCISPDVDYEIKIDHLGIIKNLSGGDLINGEDKFEHPYDFRSYAQIIMTGNGVPYIDTTKADDALYERWLFVNCPNRFQPNTELIEKLTTPEMKSAWVNWLLQGYHKLKANKWVIPNAQSAEEVEKLFTERTMLDDYMYRWANLKLVGKPEAVTPTSDLFYSYQRYLKDLGKENLMPINAAVFSKELQTKCPYPIEPVRTTIGDARVRAYKGIKIKEVI